MERISGAPNGAELLTPTIQLTSRAGGLSEIEVELPLAVATRLLEVLHAAGVQLFGVHTRRRNSWASQRIVVQESDGRPLGCERWLCLQSEILPLLDVVQPKPAAGSL